MIGGPLIAQACRFDSARSRSCFLVSLRRSPDMSFHSSCYWPSVVVANLEDSRFLPYFVTSVFIASLGHHLAIDPGNDVPANDTFRCGSDLFDGSLNFSLQSEVFWHKNALRDWFLPASKLHAQPPRARLLKHVFACNIRKRWRTELRPQRDQDLGIFGDFVRILRFSRRCWRKLERRVFNKKQKRTIRDVNLTFDKEGSSWALGSWLIDCTLGNTPTCPLANSCCPAVPDIKTLAWLGSFALGKNHLLALQSRLSWETVVS